MRKYCLAGRDVQPVGADDGSRWQELHRFGQPGLVDVRERQPCAVGRELNCQGPSDPGAGAGDDRDLVLELFIYAPARADRSRRRTRLALVRGRGRRERSAP